MDVPQDLARIPDVVDRDVVEARVELFEEKPFHERAEHGRCADRREQGEPGSRPLQDAQAEGGEGERQRRRREDPDEGVEHDPRGHGQSDRGHRKRSVVKGDIQNRAKDQTYGDGGERRERDDAKPVRAHQKVSPVVTRIWGWNPPPGMSNGTATSMRTTDGVSRAGLPDPQSHADVLQHPEVRRGIRHLAPGLADVDENGAADPQQVKQFLVADADEHLPRSAATPRQVTDAAADHRAATVAASSACTTDPFRDDHIVADHHRAGRFVDGAGDRHARRPSPIAGRRRYRGHRRRARNAG